jgi:putative transposase
MPRHARIVIPELAHHITQRGNARRAVFFTAQDRTVYLGLLQEYSVHLSITDFGLRNHVHRDAVPENEGSLAKTMLEVQGHYARYRNTSVRGAVTCGRTDIILARFSGYASRACCVILN